jgi:PD-(D/E)XK nuclease superfamily protein
MQKVREVRSRGCRNPKAVGERSEGAVIAALVKKGYSVSLPFGNNQRYDLIVEEGSRLLRAQVKTGNLCRGGISFATASTSGRVRRDYRGQADVFFVYSPELDKVYRVSVEMVGRNSGFLRVRPSKNRQVKRVRLARNFEF